MINYKIIFSVRNVSVLRLVYTTRFLCTYGNYMYICMDIYILMKSYRVPW
jgi:hypothetical protein